ncbi:MAG: YceK/YidQ family lipoprotein [Leptospirillia bacterium]
MLSYRDGSHEYHTPHKHIYGGTRMDLWAIGQWLDTHPILYPVALIPLIDLPFSLVADTVMLPFTISAARRHRPIDDPHPPFTPEKPQKTHLSR